MMVREPTAGQDFAGSGGAGIVCAGQAGDGVEEDNDVVAALDHALGFVQDDACDLDVAVGGFVEGRCDNFGVDAALHVGHFLGSFVDEENHDVGFGVILGYGVGDILEQEGLAGLGRSDDEAALALADGREHVDHAGAEGAAASGGEVEFLVGEEGSEVLEGHAVADILEGTAVDALYAAEGEVLLSFAGRADCGFDDVAGAQAVALDLGHGNVDVVRAGQVVEVGGAEESVAFGHDFQYTGCLEEAFEVVAGSLRLLVLLIEAVFLVLLTVLALVLLRLLLSGSGFGQDDGPGGHCGLLGALGLGIARCFFLLALAAGHELAAVAAGEEFAEAGVGSAEVALAFGLSGFGRILGLGLVRFGLV